MHASFLLVIQAQTYTKHDAGSHLQDVICTVDFMCNSFAFKKLLPDHVDVYYLL